MINEIHIQNFRCFEDTWVSGFRNINLIGGLNNSGKTALLEAIELSQNSNHYPLYSMRNHEMENDEEYAKGLALDYNKPVEVTAINSYTNSEGDERKVTLTIKEQDTPIDKSEWYCDEIGGINWGYSRHDSYKTDVQNKGRFTYKSLIEYQNQDKNSILFDTQDRTEWIKEAHRIKDKQERIDLFKSYLTRLNNKYVDFDYGYEGYSFDRMFHFNVITDNNQVIPYYKLGKGEQTLISIFVKLVANYKYDRYIILDDIDTHIHFTKMDLLWTILFEYVNEHPEFQVFSTTHSLEMIESFSRIANQLGQDKAMYFEMAKAIDQNIEKLVAFSQDAESLFYAIEKGLAFRGEPINYKQIKYSTTKNVDSNYW